MLQINYIFRAIVAILMTMFAIVAGSVAKGEVTGQLFPGTFSNSPPVDAIKTTTHAQSPKVLTRQLADQANLKEIDAALGSDGKTRVIVKIKASNEMKRLADNSDLTPTKIVEAFLSSAEVLYQINSNGMSVSAQYDFIPFLTVEIDANGLQMLTMHPDVVSIEPDRANRMFLSESVPLVVGVSNPWTTKYDGNKSWVAVLDSGTDVSHPMFAGKQILEACYTTNASCPNGQN